MHGQLRDDPSGDNAARYPELTVAYWRDAMIGDDTLVAAVEEVALTIVTISGSPDAYICRSTTPAGRRPSTRIRPMR